MTLDMAKRTRASLARKSTDARVLLTRETDVNVAGADRAGVAKQSAADLFLSIHFNGFDKKVRGVETFVRDKGNVNLSADKAYAQRVQDAVLSAIRRHHPGAPDRKVKLDSDVGFSMAVLSDVSLGNAGDSQPCLACLAEIEFIDHPDVETGCSTALAATQSGMRLPKRLQMLCWGNSASASLGRGPLCRLRQHRPPSASSFPRRIKPNSA